MKDGVLKKYLVTLTNHKTIEVISPHIFGVFCRSIREDGIVVDGDSWYPQSSVFKVEQLSN